MSAVANLCGRSRSSIKRLFLEHADQVVTEIGQGGPRKLLPLTALPVELQAKWAELNRAGDDAEAEDLRRFNGLPAYAQQAAIEKLNTLQAWWAVAKAKGSSTAQMKAFCAGRGISPGTLYRWQKAWDADRRCGLAAKWGEKRGERRSIGDSDAEWCVALYTDRDHALVSIEAVYDSYVLRCQGAGRPHASASTVYAVLSTPRVKQLKELALLGQREFLAKRGAAVQNTRSESQPGDVYVSDHRQHDDAVIWDDGRIVFPWLTLWEDYASTAIVGWALVEKPNSDSIKTSLARAIRAYGAPRKIHTDNGKDYRARVFVGGRIVQRERAYRYEPDRAAFDGLYIRLGCEVIFSIPYNARGKIVERFNGFLSSRFDPAVVGHRGRDVVNRPEAVDRRIAEARDALAAGRPVGLAAGTLPTRAEFAALVGDFVRWHNDRVSDAEGLRGRTPNQVWAMAPAIRRVAPDALHVLLMTARDVRVRNGRVGFSIAGQRIDWYADILHSHWEGRQVCLRYDPDDLTTVSVHERENDALICVAAREQRFPRYADPERTAKAIEEKGRRNKTLLKTIAVGDAARAELAEATVQTFLGMPDPSTLPTGPDLSAVPIELVRTGLERPAREAVAALRQAANAETVNVECGMRNGATSPREPQSTSRQPVLAPSPRRGGEGVGSALADLFQTPERQPDRPETMQWADFYDQPTKPQQPTED